MKADEKHFSSVALARSIAVGGHQQRRRSKLVRIPLAQWLCLLCWVGFSVCFGQAPPNDDFTNAIPLYGNSVTFTGTLQNATIEAGETPSACYGFDSSVWWSWTATNSTTVLIRPVGPGQNAVFGVYTGTTVSALTELGCNLMFSDNQYVYFAAVEGTTYYIRVEGYGGSSFTLWLATTNSPAILKPPRNQTVPEGESAFFSVFAAGLQPLTYQWQFERNILAGQTTPCLVLNYLTVTQAGGYSVIVSNASGVITSAVANLTISPPNPPDPWHSAICIANLKEIDFAIKLWAIEQKRGATSPVAYTDISPYLKNSVICPSGGTTFSDSYAIVDVQDTPVCLIVPLYHVLPANSLLITGQPQSQTNDGGATVTLLVSVTGLEPLVFQWQKNGTNLVDGGNISGVNADTLTITSISDSDAASYSVVVTNLSGSVTSSNAVLTVYDFPFFEPATQPLSQTVGVGSNVTFNVTAYGAPPFVFQWYYNNAPVGSPTSGTNVSSYTLTNVQTNQSGNYSVLVINGYGSLMSSNAVLTVMEFPPSIGVQPASQSVIVGGNVTFNVSVSGTAPFSYQWLFNAANIPDATNAAYTLEAVGTNQAGNYSVVVTNWLGSATSSNALLTVLVPPSIGVQPASQSVTVGGSVSFNVSVSGTVPFRYQWLFNAANIPDATNAAYTLEAVGTNQAGNYSVVVTNWLGSATSSNALLTVTVLVPPTLTLEIWAGYPLLYLDGMLSNDFMVQYSTNLGRTNWINLLFIPNLPVSPYLFLDPAGAGQPGRFYRAFMR